MSDDGIETIDLTTQVRTTPVELTTVGFAAEDYCEFPRGMLVRRHKIEEWEKEGRKVSRGMYFHRLSTEEEVAYVDLDAWEAAERVLIEARTVRPEPEVPPLLAELEGGGE